MFGAKLEACSGGSMETETAVFYYYCNGDVVQPEQDLGWVGVAQYRVRVENAQARQQLLY